MKPALTAVGAASLALLAWVLRVEVVVLFAAIMFGTALFAVAGWVADRSPLGRKGATLAIFGTGTLLILAIGAFFGQRLSGEYSELGSRLPAGIAALESRISGVPLMGGLERQLEEIRRQMVNADAAPDDGGSGESRGNTAVMIGRAAQFLSFTLNSMGRAALIFVLALYIALDGRRYATGAVRLLPPRHRGIGEELAAKLGDALPRWLLGRVTSMAIVTLLTIPGLLLLGVPLAWVLGLIAGVFSFVPILGPIAGALPAFLVTLEASPGLFWWVLGLYAAVQATESWVVTPMIQARLAAVPPLVLLGSQLVLGTLAGIAGVMFSTPIALTVMVTVQVVLLRNVYGDKDVEIAG